MSVRVIYRTSAGDKAPLCLRTTICRTRRSHASQSRMLWWWGRQPSEWMPSDDEALQERIMRHKRFIRHKYSKALRRKAIWDRDDSLPWSWRSARHFVNRTCKQSPLESKPFDVPEGQKGEGSIFTSCRSSKFKSSQAFLDHHIERDPHGILFGKRLQGPPSVNNSSWTSFSWIFEPGIAKDTETRTSLAHEYPSGVDPKVPNQPSKTRALKSEQTKEPTSSSLSDRDAPPEEEYEYDPITMRKVPKKKGIWRLENLFFAEHGVDIPVKTYKPHKVFGYGADTKGSTGLQSDEPEVATGRFGSSRKSELFSLLAKTKGNTIDTTAQFTDISEKPATPDTSNELATSTRLRDLPEPDDSTPLFSGTTYETRGQSADSSSPAPSDWLTKEGFTSTENRSTAGSTSDEPATVIPGKSFRSKLGPALDRMKPVANGKNNTGAAKLETSLDRQISKESRQGRAKAAKITEDPKDTSQDDVDLLRASDIRAATKSARLTKQEIVETKRDIRSKLETDFAKHQAQISSTAAGSSYKASRSTGQISKSLHAVWNHIREYPGGIVAKTMQSMGVFNEDYKKYLKPRSIDFTKNLTFNDEALSKTPSIYKKTKASKLASPSRSEDVEEAELAKVERTKSLRAATTNAMKQNETTNARVSQLAADIQAVYETEFGPINAEHRQPPPSNVATEPVAVKKAHPLSTASVRPGLTTNHMIDNYTRVFEPQYAQLVDTARKIRTSLLEITESLQDVPPAQKSSSKLKVLMDGTKELRRELHETALAIRAIESRRPETVWNAPSSSSTNFGKKRIDLAERKMGVPESKTESDQQQVQPSSTASEVLKKTPPVPFPATSHVQPTEVPEPFFTPPGSPVWNDEQPPPIEMLKKHDHEKPLTSAYIILAHNPPSDTIEVSSVNQAPITADQPANPILLLSKLQRAPEYLGHFERLEKAGYELYSGGKQMLIFRKKQLSPQVDDASAVISAPLVVEEPVTPPSKQAATVLDEIPTDVVPTPGPAAPTAPPTHSSDEPGKNRHQRYRVRRQESVFSGTLRPNEESPENEFDHDNYTYEQGPSSDGFFKRLTRGVKRVVLTVAALGGIAYATGVVAEGMGAQTQAQKGIDDGDVQGPRKRIVLTGQRPGIYSTESSR